MKHIILYITLLLISPVCLAASIDLSQFQDKTGAITLTDGGDKIDPYFTNKALLLAKTSGMNVTTQAKNWIDWSIIHQRANGLFARYCRSQESRFEWDDCEASDADDAALALWLEMLYAFAPKQGLPAAWQASALKAYKQLQTLLDPQTGIYHISKDLPVGLLMDNIEIYAAMRAMSHDMVRMGDKTNAAHMNHEADALRQHIYTVFWPKDGHSFIVSTQPRTENNFYPDKIAQIFPWIYGFPAPAHVNAQKDFQQWMKANKQEWLNSMANDFPWGLIAVGSIQMGDSNSAFCWSARAEPLRYSKNWNILEEAAFLRVQHDLIKHKPSVKVACTETAS